MPNYVAPQTVDAAKRDVSKAQCQRITIYRELAWRSRKSYSYFVLGLNQSKRLRCVPRRCRLPQGDGEQVYNCEMQFLLLYNHYSGAPQRIIKVDWCDF